MHNDSVDQRLFLPLLPPFDLPRLPPRCLLPPALCCRRFPPPLLLILPQIDRDRPFFDGPALAARLRFEDALLPALEPREPYTESPPRGTD